MGKTMRRSGQAVAVAPDAGRDVLILGAPWSSDDAVAICAELTGVVARVFPAEPDWLHRDAGTRGQGMRGSPPSEPCPAFAQEGELSPSRTRDATCRYRCPKGVPCARISLAPHSVPYQAHIWVLACLHASVEEDRLACLAGLQSVSPVPAERLADDDFDLAVNLLTVMAGSVQRAVKAAQDDRQATKRLTAHQKRLVLRLCHAVHTRCEDANLRLGQFAAENTVSVAYMCTLFTRAVGVPFRSYLQAWRMLKVREWLSEDRLSIKEIATRTGFNDPNRLRLAFKASTGLAPREWREKRLAGGWHV